MTLRLTPGERHIFRRRPRVAVSDWAAENIVVPDGPYSGSRYRRDVNPYLVGIMDTWGQPGVEEVVTCGSAQSGKTLALYICLAYSVDMRPGPRMLGMPDDETMDRVSKGKLRPLLRKSPATRRLLGKMTGGQIAFRDGTRLYLSSAQSPAQRASISVQDLFLDEEALYRQIVGQGVPVTDFKERTRSYSHKRKIMRGSKPVGDESCSICKFLEEEADEVRHYEVRCPGCMAPQIMEESGLYAVGDCTDPQRIEREKLGRYRCAKCGYGWSDYTRDVAVKLGKWVAEVPVPSPVRVGFHLPAILSSRVSISEVLATKMRAEAAGVPDELQAYHNGMWAKPYKPVVAETSESEILALRDMELPARTVPSGCIALTAGIDMQKRWFWFVVCAWTAALDCTVVDYGRVRDWADVGALVHETHYEREEGGVLPIWRAALDTGGGESDMSIYTRTEEAYQYVRRMGMNRLFAVKGSSRPMLEPVKWTVVDRLPRSRTPIPGGLTLYRFDPNYFKSLVHARLTKDARQPLRLHAEVETSFAEQLTAERLMRDRTGKTHWQRISKNNHYLDCMAMASACAHGTWAPSLQLLAERMATSAAYRPEMQPPADTPHKTPVQGPSWLASRRSV